MVTAEARSARPEDLPAVIGLVDAAMRAGTDQTMQRDYPLVYAPDNLPNVQVVEADGRVVATSPVLPRHAVGDGYAFDLGIISPTATDPGHQHRGYGTACVRACIARMEALAIPVSVLWTQVETFPFYEVTGYQAVARYGQSFRLSNADAVRFRASTDQVVDLRSAPEHLAALLDLQASRSDRIVRSPGDAELLHRLAKMTTWLAVRDGRPIAYLVDSRAINKPGLLELGGDETAVEGLLRRVLAGLGSGQALDLQVGFVPDPFDAIAARALAGVEGTPYGGSMMIRLNDPAGFLRSIRSWLAAAVPRDAPAVTIHVTDPADGLDEVVSVERRPYGFAIGERRHPVAVDLSRRELTSIVFGAHPARPFDVPPALAWFPPFRMPIAVLDRS